MSDQADPGATGTRPRMPLWVKVFVALGVVVAVLAILMLAGVLGGGHGPGRHFSGGMSQDTANIGGPADEAAATHAIEVSASDTFAFEPASVTVSAGETVAFEVTNEGKTAHEFTLGDAAMQQQHARMMAHVPAGMGHDTPNSIRLDPGQTKRIAWRFGDAGTLEFACHVQGHYQAGMRGRITIS